MPLEIRELIIKVTVKETNNNGTTAITEDVIIEIKNRVVKECVDKILLKIERQNDR